MTDRAPWTWLWNRWRAAKKAPAIKHPERLTHIPPEKRTPEHYVNSEMVNWLRRIEGAGQT